MVDYYKNDRVYYSLYDFSDGEVVDVIDGAAAYTAVVKRGANDVRRLEPLRRCVYCDSPIHFGDVECWRCGAR